MSQFSRVVQEVLKDQIARWQEEQSYQRTRQLRPDLLNE